MFYLVRRNKSPVNKKEGRFIIIKGSRNEERNKRKRFANISFYNVCFNTFTQFK